MKKNKKKKFRDLDEYNKEYNNNLTKKQNNDTFSKYDKEESNNIKKKNDFKSSLDKLIFLFPNFTPDLIQDTYEENDNNYSKTKEFLTKLAEEEDDNKNNEENKINVNNNIINDSNKINEEEKDRNNNNLKNNIDITYMAKFEVFDDNEFLGGNQEKNKENKKEKEKENIDTNDYLVKSKDKNKKEYCSIFNEETITNNNNNINCSTNNPLKDEIVIDEYLWQDYIVFLCECFPFYTREEIISKICEYNFDTDKAILDLLNDKNINFQQSEDDYENMEIIDSDEIISNFVSYENGQKSDFDINLLKENSVQKAIEEQIKNENSKKKNKFYDDDIDYVIEDNNKKEKEKEVEEYFINTPIDEIKTPAYKEDLKKLIKHFPLQDEFVIKWAYYQYLDYKETYKYLSRKDENNLFGLRHLLLSKNNITDTKSQVKRNNNKKNKKTTNKYIDEEEERQFEIFKKIINKKPINWKLEECSNVNLNDYMAVRKRLILEARNSFNNQKYKNGQILMAKAKRYKQEIDQLYKKQKYQQFLHNNDSRYRNSNEIDLHGLDVRESKYIIDKKIKALKEKKIENNLKSISLTIITGTGSHSAGHQSVLFPNLLEWLKGRDKLSAYGDLNKGSIFVTIY